MFIFFILLFLLLCLIHITFGEMYDDWSGMRGSDEKQPFLGENSPLIEHYKNYQVKTTFLSSYLWALLTRLHDYQD